MSNAYYTTEVTGTAQVPLVRSGDEPTLLFNGDPANTIYLSKDYGAQPGQSNTVPLAPGATVVVDGKDTIYGVAAIGLSASVYVIPGGLSYFQLLNLIVRNLTITAGGSIRGPNWILNSLGYVQYGGTPASGNVIQSWVPAFANDQFGNPVAGGGITQFISANGQTILANEAIAIRTGVSGSSPGTWTEVAAPIGATNVSSFSVTPNAVNNVILVAVAQQSNKTVTATALASTNATWTLLGSFKGTNTTRTIAIFAGLASATSAATVTVTWSGSAPAIIRIAHQEFTPSSGSYTQDGAIATMDVVTPQTAWPVMTPAEANELYWGYNIVNGSPTAGSQSDFVYFTSIAQNTVAYDLAVTAGGEGAIWGNATQQFGATVLLQAGAGGGAGFTGLILAPGSQNFQQIQIFNTSSTATLTFAAPNISNVADGTSDSIGPLSAAGYIWSQADKLWYPL